MLRTVPPGRQGCKWERGSAKLEKPHELGKLVRSIICKVFRSHSVAQVNAFVCEEGTDSFGFQLARRQISRRVGEYGNEGIPVDVQRTTSHPSPFSQEMLDRQRVPRRESVSFDEEGRGRRIRLAAVGSVVAGVVIVVIVAVIVVALVADVALLVVDSNGGDVRWKDLE